MTRGGVKTRWVVLGSLVPIIVLILLLWLILHRGTAH